MNGRSILAGLPNSNLCLHGILVKLSVHFNKLCKTLGYDASGIPNISLKKGLSKIFQKVPIDRLWSLTDPNPGLGVQGGPQIGDPGSLALNFETGKCLGDPHESFPDSERVPCIQSMLAAPK